MFPFAPEWDVGCMQASGQRCAQPTQLHPTGASLQAACALDSRCLKIRPRKGDAVLFYPTLPNGSFDPLAHHGSCPVGQGQSQGKWIAQKWFHDVPYF